MRVVVTSDVPADAARLREAVMALGHEPADTANADFAILSAGLDLGAALAALQRLSVHLPVFVVGDGADAPALLRSGARGYLRWSALVPDLDDTVEQLRAGPVPVAHGRLITVTGPLAGVGVTTVATNLAFAAGRAMLAQFDAPADLALNLGLEPDRPMAELAAGWPRLDALQLRRFVVDHSAGVAVLAEPPGNFGVVNWPTAALRHVTTLLRGLYPTVVIDLGTRLDPSRSALLQLADTVAIVVRPDVPSARAARDHVRRLLEVGIATEKLVTVVNRFGQPGSLPWGEVRGGLPTYSAAIVPDDPERALIALNSGQPMVRLAAETEVGRAFTELAAAA